jgi:peptidyl-tRNA hydrolase, PTH2 family
MEKKAKQVIVVRKDLNMRKGKIGAQVAHASLGAILKLMDLHYETDDKKAKILVYYKDDALGQWLDGKFTKICPYVNSEEELLEIQRKADELGIVNCLIQDSGDTEFHGVPTYTVVALGPAWSDEIDQITRHLKLL